MVQQLDSCGIELQIVSNGHFIEHFYVDVAILLFRVQTDRPSDRPPSDQVYSIISIWDLCMRRGAVNRLTTPTR